ncbi:MAG: hypothetical protein BWY98_01130 [Tenericutes bacterium ADurb.BinA155]|jgi:hypothetical protein|nr:MAG: hypothetical protein BWY98_01130 [Tenericutes bacterium ADurb.BinA155]
MGIFKRNKKGGLADVIRCDLPTYLVWRWHPEGVPAGEGKRETAIRTHSVLHVKTGEVALFVYKQKDGTLEDAIVGPYDDTLKTKNFPVLSSLIGLWYDGDTPFQAEVYFINLAEIIQIKFGVPYFGVVDPRFPDFDVPVAVRGTLTFKIEDYKAFIKCHRLIDFDLETFKGQVNDALCRYLKEAVTKAPAENDIPLIAIESKIDLINEKAELLVKDRLNADFGVAVTGLDLSAIDVDKESQAYQDLAKVTKEVVSRKSEANVKDYEESLRIQREEAQYAAHMKTRQGNLGAYQTEVKGNVGVAGANALGEMGKKGAGEVSTGGCGAGFNPVSIMAGMAVGSAVGQNVAGTLNSSIAGANSVPPAVPTICYYIAENNQPVGPFELAKIKEMIGAGQVKGDTLIWKQGTPTWEKADSFAELNGSFPPPLK